MTRRNEPTPLGDIIAEDASELLPPRLREMTDEQWAEHDAAVTASQERQAARDRATAERVARARLRDYNIPAKDLELILSEAMLQQTAPMIALVSFWMTPPRTPAGRIVVLAGSVGCGKSFAATTWLVQHRHRPNFPVFVDGHQMARWPRFHNEHMKTLEAASALVIDDLGAEYDDRGGALVSFVDGVLNTRYRNGRPTVITTNVPQEVFKKRYGDRVADRIRENGAWFWFREPSLRPKKS